MENINQLYPNVYVDTQASVTINTSTHRNNLKLARHEFIKSIVQSSYILILFLILTYLGLAVGHSLFCISPAHHSNIFQFPC